MVLAELGGKLRDSLRKFQSSASSNQEEQVNALLSDISRALIESDVSVKLVMQVRDNIKKRIATVTDDRRTSKNSNLNVSKVVQQAVMDELVQLLTPSNKKPYQMKRGRPNIILFVGLQGAGKTTTIAKFANYYAKRNWKCAMVCADTFRAGALDQLKQNATKLRIPFYGSYSEADPVVIAQEGVAQFTKNNKANSNQNNPLKKKRNASASGSGYEIIIVDTSGRHQQEAALLDEMRELSAAIRPHHTIFVMDATQGQAIYDQALAFREAVDVGSVICTKLDGHAKGGGALSAVAATQSPILFLGSGEHFDDLELFDAESFVSKLLGYADFKGFMNELKSMQDPKGQKEMMENMKKGQFTLKDMYNQFQSILKMGPLNKVMGNNADAMPDYLMPHNDESTRRLKVFMYIMDSMTESELDGTVDWKDFLDTKHKSRIHRIAAGSGRHPKEVQLLLQTHSQMKSFVGKMGKSSSSNPANNPAMQRQLAAQMKKNPTLLNQRLNQMDPAMIAQMGGRDAVLKMMQDMTKNNGAGAGASAETQQTAALQAMMAAAAGGGGLGGMMMPPPLGMGGGSAGGMPNMQEMMKMMQQMGRGRGSANMNDIPNMPNMNR